MTAWERWRRDEVEAGLTLSDEQEARLRLTITQAAGPQTDEEWMIHSLNVQGVFFERWCRFVISKLSAWDIKYTSHPVSVGDKERNLDIRADLTTPSLLVSLLIEC